MTDTNLSSNLNYEAAVKWLKDVAESGSNTGVVKSGVLANYASLLLQHLAPVETKAERREYHANGTYWSGVPTVDMPCDFCTRGIMEHDPRTHACLSVEPTRKDMTPEQNSEPWWFAELDEINRIRARGLVAQLRAQHIGLAAQIEAARARKWMADASKELADAATRSAVGPAARKATYRDIFPDDPTWWKEGMKGPWFELPSRLPP